MATFQGIKAAGAQNAIAGIGDGQAPKVLTFTYTWGTALLLNDIIRSPLIGKGATIVDVMLVTDSMGAAAVTLDVGDTADPDRWIAASTIGVAGGVARASAVTAKPYTLPNNGTVDVLIKVAPTTPTASGTIAVNVLYLPANT